MVVAGCLVTLPEFLRVARRTGDRCHVLQVGLICDTGHVLYVYCIILFYFVLYLVFGQITV